LNKDKELSFEEFTIVLAKVTDDAHRIIHNHDRYTRCDPDLVLCVCFSQGCQTQGPLSELEKAIDVIIDVFHQYSRREGDKDTLTKKELKLLIEKQLANYLKHVKNQATIDQIFRDLDINKDDQLSFGEVMLLIVRVIVATHEHLHFCEDHQHQQQHQHQHQHNH
ncbi:M126 protein, partial [Odontophorus gujanensis]|nr:M126 protein [Odontophorus gujanensis]